jgi:hypothetical protein
VIGQKRPLRHEGATGVVDTSDVQPFSFGVHGWENQASISVNADEGDRDDGNLPTDGHPAICETLPLDNSADDPAGLEVGKGGKACVRDISWRNEAVGGIFFIFSLITH